MHIVIIELQTIANNYVNKDVVWHEIQVACASAPIKVRDSLEMVSSITSTLNSAMKSRQDALTIVPFQHNNSTLSSTFNLCPKEEFGKGDNLQGPDCGHNERVKCSSDRIVQEQVLADVTKADRSGNYVHQSNKNSIISENEIASLFSGLESTQRLNSGVHIFNKSALQKLIHYFPNRLLSYIKNVNDSGLVIVNISGLLSENMFFRLLHIIDGYLGIKAYRYFSIIKNVISSEFSGDLVIQKINSLKQIILQWLLKPGPSNLSESRLLFEIVAMYTENQTAIEKSRFVSELEIQLTKNNIEYPDNNAVHDIPNENNVSNLFKDNSLNYQIKAHEQPEHQKKIASLAKFLDEDSMPYEIPIENAGIVIGGAYFERLFTMLKITEDKKFKDTVSIQKAIKLLYYFCRHKIDCWEHELMLNKILCGLDFNHPLDNNVEILDEEKNTVDGLIDAILKNWPVMSNTTPDGLRESFLQRKGFLITNEEGWLLNVEKKPFDMLIDTLPWGLSMIKFPWMKGVLRVNWKAP
jgi:hypothetical protein